jgi:hypothetical protein
MGHELFPGASILFKAVQEGVCLHCFVPPFSPCLNAYQNFSELSEIKRPAGRLIPTMSHEIVFSQF